MLRCCSCGTLWMDFCIYMCEYWVCFFFCEIAATSRYALLCCWYRVKFGGRRMKRGKVTDQWNMKASLWYGLVVCALRMMWCGGGGGSDVRRWIRPSVRVSRVFDVLCAILYLNRWDEVGGLGGLIGGFGTNPLVHNTLPIELFLYSDSEYLCIEVWWTSPPGWSVGRKYLEK